MNHDMLDTLKMSLIFNNQNNIFFTIIIIIFFSLFRINNFEEIIEYGTAIMHKMFFNQNINHIILEGKTTTRTGEYICRIDNLFSDRFKAIWIYINSNNNKTIYSVKEFSMSCNNYKDCRMGGSDYIDDVICENNENFFIVNQKRKFLIQDGIYCSVKFLNDKIEQQNGRCNLNIENIYLDIFSYKHNIHYISKFIDNITNEYITKVQNTRKNKIFIYTLKGKDTNREDRRNTTSWDECEFKTTRDFSNLFFDNKVNLINKIKFFNNNKSWYQHNGHPYTFGIGLYGPPGTGKTSVIKCIAKMLKRHLIVIPLSKISTQREFSEYYFEKTYNEDNQKGSITFKNKIIVLEDIDCMTDIVKNRKTIKEESISNDSFIDEDNEDTSDNTNTKDIIKKLNKLNKKDSYNVLNNIDKNNDKITLSYLLNIIDGIRETPGRILIITSNHYNKLDNALVRPGRIDIKLEMKNASANTINQMYCHYYDEVLDTEIVEKLVDDKISPATITNIYLNSKNKEHFKELILENINN